ncbi:hypothetical protein [Microlunatus speluncae]|uniref:hypothetical protein n=1 Tax=Microlunatus speluncae TaxID=2594267 RepID=UPI00126656DD|nr:hypothetical protein [Microlunatus speluncae]
MTAQIQRYDLGAGAVLVAPDGSILQVLHPRTGRTVLLDESDPQDRRFHDESRRWGKGFCVIDTGATPIGLRWDQPDRVDSVERGWVQRQAWPDEGLALRIDRRFGDHWTETYTLSNTGAAPLRIGSVGVSTPWRDVYHSSADSLAGAVHAHVWPGGADAYAWAEPMDGGGPGLGLVLTAGELWAYSVESRDIVTSSNVRGHLYLHPTDVLRSPDAFGGQPKITIEPGAELTWSWRLGWYDDLAALHADRDPILVTDQLLAETGESIMITSGPDSVPLTPVGPARLDAGSVTSEVPGEVELRAERDGRTARVNLFFHRPLRQIVEQRIAFIAARQLARERPGAGAAAFVPYDRRDGLTTLPTAWGDWNDVRERVAMPILLQQARLRGWGDPALIDELLAGHAAFVEQRVVDPEGNVADDSRLPGRTRLYNFPWYARFFAAQHALYGDRQDLDLAATIIERYYALGGERFLAFWLGGIIRDLAAALETAGDHERAEGLRRLLVGHGRYFVGVATELPGHEVNYEQSMVAPLLDLLGHAHRIDPAAVPAAEVALRLPWLTAFAGDQPDARLRHIPIRHWDGYWFGAERHWGDVFPHYWSVLSAEVFLGLPDGVVPSARQAELRAQGAAILRANLINFADDGWATCAFVYPSCVNGNPTHHADPLANDQDWALVAALDHPEVFPH